MKRTVAIILFFLYVIPAIGINISVHYCGGEISSVSLGSNYADKCVCGSKKMKKDCCNDKHFSFKIKYDQHKASQATINFSKVFAPHPIAFTAYTISFQPVVENTLFNDYHPPDKLKQPLYIFNQVFRI